MLKGHSSLERLLGRSASRKRGRGKDSSDKQKRRRADTSMCFFKLPKPYLYHIYCLLSLDPAVKHSKLSSVGTAEIRELDNGGIH